MNHFFIKVKPIFPLRGSEGTRKRAKALLRTELRGLKPYYEPNYSLFRNNLSRSQSPSPFLVEGFRVRGCTTSLLNKL